MLRMSRMICVCVIGRSVTLLIAAEEHRRPERLTLSWSNPPDGWVDVGRDRDRLGLADGVRSFDLKFNQPVELTHDRVDVISTSSNPPSIKQIVGYAHHWRIELEQPIPPGETTILSVDHGGVFVHVYSRPGDVNGDLRSDEQDYEFLRETVSTAQGYDTYFDIDRNGTLDGEDVTQLGVLLFGDGNGSPWLGIQHGPSTTAKCCCDGDYCFVYPAGCPEGVSAGTCPCGPSSCRWLLP